MKIKLSNKIYFKTIVWSFLFSFFFFFLFRLLKFFFQYYTSIENLPVMKNSINIIGKTSKIAYLNFWKYGVTHKRADEMQKFQFLLLLNYEMAPNVFQNCLTYYHQRWRDYKIPRDYRSLTWYRLSK